MPLHFDGNITNYTEAPDPRLGAQVQYPQTSTVTLPSGLSFLTTMTRDATVSAEDGSLENQTDTMTANGNAYTLVYTYDSDTNTRLFTKTTPEGRDFVTEIDDVGRVLESQTADLDPMTFTYDTRGRLEFIYYGTVDIRTTQVAYHPTTGFIQFVTNSDPFIIGCFSGILSYYWHAHANTQEQTLKELKKKLIITSIIGTIILYFLIPFLPE